MDNTKNKAPYVLLVEDDEMVRAKLESLLEDAGFAVLGVSTCAQARNAVKAVICPFMIIDRHLEDGDGIDLLAEFRTVYGSNRVFMMLLTALDSPDETARGLAAGADAYLSKRSSDEMILAQLRAAKEIVQLRMR